MLIRMEKNTLITKRSHLLITALLSTGYILLIIQLLNLITDHILFWTTLILGVYVVGVTLGWHNSSHNILKEKGLRQSWFKNMVLLLLLGAIAPLIISMAHFVYLYLLGASEVVTALIVLPLWLTFIILGLGFFYGSHTFYTVQLRKVSIGLHGWNREFYACLTSTGIGTVAGVILFAVVLTPFFGVLTGAIILSLLGATYVTISTYLSRGRDNRAFQVGVLSSLALLVGTLLSPTINDYFNVKYYYHDRASRITHTVFSPIKTPLHIDRYSFPGIHIDVLQNRQDTLSFILANGYSNKFIVDPRFPKNLRLYVNGILQVRSDTNEFFHEWFAHVPVMRAGQTPENVLILNGGDGLLANELLKYDSIQSLTVVEADPVTLQIGKNHPDIVYMNRGSLKDDRVTTVVNEPLRYTRSHSELFDAIYIDVKNPAGLDGNRYYSKEFLSGIKDSLTDDGYLVLLAPGAAPVDLRGMLPGFALPEFQATLQSVGFTTITPYRTWLETGTEPLQEYAIKTLNPAKKAWYEDPTNSMYEKEFLLRTITERFAQSQTQSFIIAWNGTAGEGQWTESLVDLYALNQRRYIGAFPESPQIDAGQTEPRSLINSHIKTSVLHLRKPF